MHNKTKDPDSIYIPIDFSDSFDDDTRETRRMMHNCGYKTGAREGTELYQTIGQ